jgi:hypothetical protein
MERSVVVGGLLVSVSLMLSVMLSSYARREALHVGASAGGAPIAEAPADPQPVVPVAPKVETAKSAQDDVSPSATEASHSARETSSN